MTLRVSIQEVESLALTYRASLTSVNGSIVKSNIKIKFSKESYKEADYFIKNMAKYLNIQEYIRRFDKIQKLLRDY